MRREEKEKEKLTSDNAATFIMEHHPCFIAYGDTIFSFEAWEKDAMSQVYVVHCYILWATT